MPHVRQNFENCSKNLIEAKIGQNIIYLPLDSGADVSIIDEKLIKGLPYNIVKGKNVNLTDVQGNAIPSKHWVNLNIDIGGIEITHTFMVVKELDQKTPVIMGVDFLTRHKAIIDWENQEFVMGDVSVPLRTYQGKRILRRETTLEESETSLNTNANREEYEKLDVKIEEMKSELLEALNKCVEKRNEEEEAANLKEEIMEVRSEVEQLKLCLLEAKSERAENRIEEERVAKLQEKIKCLKSVLNEVMDKEEDCLREESEKQSSEKCAQNALKKKSKKKTAKREQVNESRIQANKVEVKKEESEDERDVNVAVESSDNHGDYETTAENSQLPTESRNSGHISILLKEKLQIPARSEVVSVGNSGGVANFSNLIIEPAEIQHPGIVVARGPYKTDQCYSKTNHVKC